MINRYEENIKRPRTIDLLQTRDCVEIIIRDLERYGVLEDKIFNLISEYFVPLKDEVIILKEKYGEMCFSESPDYIFFDDNN